MKGIQSIKDWRGKIIGWIQEDSAGNKIVKDFYGRILGKYDKRSDVTRDFYGKIVARGDQSSMLLNFKK